MRRVLSPELTLFPKAAESWTEPGTHLEPPPALQGNILSVVDVSCGIGETAPNCSLATVPSCCRSRGIPLSTSFSRNCLGMPGTACSLLAGWEHLPFPRLARKTPQQRGAKEKPWGQRSCVEQARGREAAEWNGTHWRKPRPPCLHRLGTLCCWGSVPLTRRQLELSDALVGVCAGSEPRARVPKPNPRAVVAVHSSEIILKQTAGHRSCGCPLPGSPQGPRAACLQTSTPLGGPGSSLWGRAWWGLLCSQGC